MYLSREELLNFSPFARGQSVILIHDIKAKTLNKLQAGYQLIVDEVKFRNPSADISTPKYDASDASDMKAYSDTFKYICTIPSTGDKITLLAHEIISDMPTERNKDPEYYEEIYAEKCKTLNKEIDERCQNNRVADLIAFLAVFIITVGAGMICKTHPATAMTTALVITGIFAVIILHVFSDDENFYIEKKGIHNAKNDKIRV